MYPSKRLQPILLAMTIAASTAWAQTSDTTPPRLVSFTFSPTTVDVSTAGKTVVAIATITDNLAGLSWGLVTFGSPNGQYVNANLFRLTGTPLNGTYQATINLPLHLQAATWKAQVYLYDLAGNSQTLGFTDLQTLGFPTDLVVTDGTPDVQPPVPLSASFSPTSIDVSSAGANVTVSLRISDNLSGGYISEVVLAPVGGSATARQILFGYQFQLVSGTALDGTWQAVQTMPRYSPAGPWQILVLYLVDAATNTVAFNSGQLQAMGINPIFTVNSTPTDVTNPTLTNLRFSPRVFDTSAGQQTVAVTIGAADNLSGVDFPPIYSRIGLISPSGNQAVYVGSYPPPGNVGGTPLSGTWQTSAIWPQYSEQGTWQVSYLLVVDAVGNYTVYSAAMLRAMGLPDSVVVLRPSLSTDGVVGPAGGTITDTDFGSRASIAFPPGTVATPNTAVAIDVFPDPLAVPTPRGFTIPGTYFVNVSFSPALARPIPSPGVTLVLPLTTQMTAGARLSLYHIDPVTGNVAPAMNAMGRFVTGTVNSDMLSATFLNVATLSTVVAYLSNGSVLGDVDGNGSVTCADVGLVKTSFGKRFGQPGFNLAADLNSDNIVDIRDLFVITRQLPAGVTCQ